jgi:hypothetical protein
VRRAGSAEAFGCDDEAGRARYDALFESCPGAFIQQSSLWADAIAPLGPDRPLLLVWHDGTRDVAGLPLYLYLHPLGNVMTSVPQPGPLGGIFVRPGLVEDEVERAYAGLLARAVELARQEECLAFTVITNPFAPDLDRYRRHLEPEYELRNFTQFVPLDEVVAGNRLTLRDANRRSNLSRALRRAREAGFTVREAAGTDDFQRWYEVHRARHTDLGAAPLERTLLERLLSILAPAKARLWLVCRGDEIASGCLFVHHRQVLDVCMLSAAPAHLEDGPNYLNTEHSLLWAAGLGVKVYNWQSSPGRLSGVYRYKAQWGSREAPYSFVTRRFCPPERLRRIGPDGARAEYRGHYLAPFPVLESGAAQGRFEK